ncbi:MAG: ADP-ribose pyrophosphatase [Myxococcales bacterium]|nr:ADP-ribose pyrophosphatase [Myxococcales bacterium]
MSTDDEHIAERNAERIAERILGQGKYLMLVERGGWEFVHRFSCTGVVIIVAITDDNRLVLVEQFRPAVGRRVLELPAGLVGDTATWRDEALVDAAHRELIEETGWQATTMTRLAESPTAVGFSSERLTFFAASGLIKVGPGGGDETEDIVVHEVDRGELPSFVARKEQEGLLVDYKIFAGLYLAKANSP